MPELPRLLLITDRRRSPRGLPWAIQQALSVAPAGIVGVVLREKDLDGAALLHLAQEVREITERFGAPLVINGRCDIAIACGAEGVHLGGDAPSCVDVRARFGETIWVGVSLHKGDVTPVGATYGLLSPIFPTRSKPGAAPLGVNILRQRCHASMAPMYALGGVAPENVKTCLSAGARGVATLGGVLTQPDPARSLVEWLVDLEGRKAQA